MGLVQTNVGSYKNMVALPFYATNIGNTDGTMVGVSGVTQDYVLPVDSWIVGASARLDGTLTTGTLNLAPSVGGSAVSRTWSGGNADLWAQGAYVTQEAGADGLYFVPAGTAIGLTWSKSATVSPTTRDANALLLVLMDNYVY